MPPAKDVNTTKGDGVVSDLSFDVELMWSETAGKGAGEIKTDDLVLELSGPKSMGGRGIGTNPEELLVCAVSSCFTATLFGVLSRAQLPVDSLAVDASGTVTGFPGHARFARIVVSPTIMSTKLRRESPTSAASSGARSPQRWLTRSARYRCERMPRSTPTSAHPLGERHECHDDRRARQTNLRRG
jgi:peroxiredoxin-like protein